MVRCPACDPRNENEFHGAMHTCKAVVGDKSTEQRKIEQLLRSILKEAELANNVIALNRDGGGQGRIKVATAMHRIADRARRGVALLEGSSNHDSGEVSNG